ncbi:MAG: magnesium transporter [Alphaproteobacteria bacterium]
MTDAPELNETAAESGDAERLYGVDEAVVRRVSAAIETDDLTGLEMLLEPLHASDVADLIEALNSEQRGTLLAWMRDRIDPETLAYLDESVREEVLEQLDPEEVAAAITELETDDALNVIEDLEPEEQEAVLRELSPPDRAILEEALSFPEDSAGRLMQRELVTVPETWSVGDTIDYMRNRAAHLPTDFYDIFVVDTDRKPLGKVPLSRLMRHRRPIQVADILIADTYPVPVAMDQEEVALMFQQYSLVSAPVVNEAGRLVGVITVDDIVVVIHEEAEEDILRLGGVREDDFYDAVLDTTRSRFSWLLINLGTAIAASLVIGVFETTIERIVALAVLMPIVASMGGNAGTQTLTVAVRALAMKELTPSNAVRIVAKEVLVGGINGVIFAFLVGIIAWLWFHDPLIGGVIAAALIINLLLAGVAGLIIPLALERLRIDPAVASSVVLTTVTDVVGFFAFLGLAAVVLL